MSQLCVTTLMLILTVTTLVGCTNANVTVSGLTLPTAASKPIPGYSTDSISSSSLTGSGGIVMKARVSALPTTSLTGGGITLNAGVVH